MRTLGRVKSSFLDFLNEPVGDDPGRQSEGSHSQDGDDSPEKLTYWCDGIDVPITHGGHGCDPSPHGRGDTRKGLRLNLILQKINKAGRQHE